MDEQFQTSLQTSEVLAADLPREVVLRYDAPRPRPIVERYVAPEPLPGRRKAGDESAPSASPMPNADRYVFTPPPAPPKRSRKGLWIFLGCVGALLVTLAVLVLPRIGRTGTTAQAPFSVHRDEWDRPGNYSANDSAATETTIERYPNGDGTRLRYAEIHGGELTIQEIYELVNPCTVTVATALPGGSAIIGTGVIFTPDGYILTNAHVITGGEQCYVVLDNGRSYTDVKLVGYDEEQDLAVIKIDAYSLPTAEFGDSDALTVGDTVYAIGNPLGVELRGTLTDGIVSAINRDVLVDGIKMTLIQTNAALNNGNSGGPLINTYGQVVGINTMKMGSSRATVEGLGFAIPISSTAWMVDDLLAYGKIHGEPVLGITVLHSTVTLPTGETALQIYQIEESSAAERFGLMTGDCIVRADGEALESVNDLLRIRRRYRAGEALTLEIDRNGARLTADVLLEEARN